MILTESLSEATTHGKYLFGLKRDMTKLQQSEKSERLWGLESGVLLYQRMNQIYIGVPGDNDAYLQYCTIFKYYSLNSM
jgi:hypothetical protein